MWNSLKFEDNPQLAYYNMRTKIQRMRYLDLTKKKEIREQQGPYIRFEFYLFFMIFNISSTPLCKVRESGFKVVINQIRELTIQQSANAKWHNFS